MELEKLKPYIADIGIGITTLITGAIHLSLGGALFVLNGLGFIGLGAAFLLPISFLQPWKEVVRWLLVGYTLLTIALYFVFHPNGTWQQDGLGIATKFIEILLLLLLIYSWQEKSMVSKGL